MRGPLLRRYNMFQKLFLLLLGITVVASRCTHFYRKDYTYVDKFDAFYKLHWDLGGQSWNSAFLACDDEGSVLFYPKTANEWTIVKGLVATMKVKPNVTDVFVGIHDEFGLGEYMTVDGSSTPSPLPEKDQTADVQSTCVTMDIDSGAYKLELCATDNIKPFVCKKVQDVVPFCPTIDRDYSYDEEAKKCYKFSQKKKTWTDAMQTCFMEGGILAIVKTPEEGNAINRRIIQQRNHKRDYFTGFRRIFPQGEYYTVKGQQYDDTFYRQWRSENDGIHDKQFDCGVIINNPPYTSTRNCNEPAPFICEMEPRT